MGGTCILDSNDTVQTISGHKVTHVSMLPVVLANTLGRLPKDYEKSTNLTVLVFGAPLSEQLRTRALQDFATDIIASYGTTETASICAIRPDGTGTVFPGVTVEVVDETDRPLIGQPGRVRVKSAGCISGYEDNPDATERMFKNGWFYPGDVGVMNGIRSLKLLGRVDNLINVGGIKLDSEKVEDELRGIISVNDLCVTTIPNTDGIHRVYIAVVLGSSTKLKDLMEAITSNKNMDLGKFILVEVKEIPRSGPGKVQREKLRELILDSTKQAIGP
jgi:acyl-CoA synthetase (AMP-forming)/AMP-acid ligase II